MTLRARFEEARRDPEKLLFALLLALHLVPIWAFRFVPSIDGPAHLANAVILREYSFPERAIFREYYTLNPNLDPNWFSHVALAGLMYLFPPLLAEKIFLSGYVLLLPVSVRRALRAIRPESGFLAFASFPFVYNILFHFGFWNFVWSLPVFFFLVAEWIEWDRARGRWAAFRLAGLGLLLYFCHIVTTVLALILMVVLTLWLPTVAAAERSAAGGPRARRWWRALRPRLTATLLVAAPVAVPALYFLGGREGAVLPPNSAWILWDRLRGLVTLNSHHPRERYLAIAVAGGIAAMVVFFAVLKILNRSISTGDGLLLLVPVYTAVLFSAPEAMYGGTGMSIRLVLFPYFAALLWLGAQTWSKWGRRAIVPAACVISILYLASHTWTFARLNDLLEEYVGAAQKIDTGTTLLPLHYGDSVVDPVTKEEISRLNVFRHAADYIAALRGVVDLDNYEAAQSYFPARWRPERDPYASMDGEDGGIETNPPCADFLSYPSRTGGRVDYVLLWNLEQAPRAHPCTLDVARQLQRGYTRIAVSPPRELGQLFRRNDEAPGAR